LIGKRAVIAVACLGALLFVAYVCALGIYSLGYMQGIAAQGASAAFGDVLVLQRCGAAMRAMRSRRSIRRWTEYRHVLDL
jgi:hypothetical protein